MADSKDFDKILQGEFEWLHRHPELALLEVNTTEHIKIFLQNHGIELLDLPVKTGVLAIIRGKSMHPLAALRADIDALPLQEESELSCRSEIPGKMHACGHDFHTAALLGAALLLNKRKDELEGSIKLLFQPAEETASGAEKVLKTGVLDDVDVIFGLHVRADGNPGVIYVKSGADHAAVDHFLIDIKGTGTHAAHPNLGADPIIAAAALISSFQTVVSRNVDPMSESVVSVTRIQSGSTWNIIPGEAQLEGTTRSFDEVTRQLIQKRLEEIARGISTAYGVNISLKWLSGNPSTNNDSGLVDFVRKTALGLGYPVEPAVASMGGEDFAVFQKKIPGVIWQIGVGSRYFLHHPKFTADTSALPKAACLLAALGEQILIEKK
jgi:amidohydrolase